MQYMNTNVFYWHCSDHVSAGKALKLNINFHKRTGNAKQQKVAIIHKSWYVTQQQDCQDRNSNLLFLQFYSPVAAKQDKYVTYTKKWTIPKNTKPGSYAVDFVELVQFRRGQITATETVKVNIVD